MLVKEEAMRILQLIQRICIVKWRDNVSQHEGIDSMNGRET